MAVDVLTKADLSKYAKVGNYNPTFRDSEVWEQLSQYGSLHTLSFPAGDLVTLLPSLNVPVSWLDRNNWVKTIPMGNFRDVRAIRVTNDPTEAAIVIKSPERVFTNSLKLLKASRRPWWGGPRSKERPIAIENNTIVEEQAAWEALILLELRSQGVRAEVPQALIQNPDGETELIVKEIPFQREPKKSGPSWDEIFKKVKQAGLIPNDSGGHNCLSDEKGNTVLIDTNRWHWPPYTNNFRERLLAEVITAANLCSFTPGR